MLSIEQPLHISRKNHAKIGKYLYINAVLHVFLHFEIHSLTIVLTFPYLCSLKIARIMIKLLIMGALGFVLYRLVFQPAREGYLDNSKPRIVKKKGQKPKSKKGDYTDYEEID